MILRTIKCGGGILMSKAKAPYYEIPSGELADWILQQGEERWWNVDGDSLLTGLLSFPCPGDELAEELLRINKPLHVLVSANHADAKGEIIGKDKLDGLVGRMGENVVISGKIPPWVNDRVLCLRWKGAPVEWLLVEDTETSEENQRDIAAGSREE
jgi:hypothetical protein